MKTFLICPVRGYDPNEWKVYVDDLERMGFEVHWPPRDTFQNDPIGLGICKENYEAIRRASVVHVIWDGKSIGCLFDLGMAFALGKKIVVLALPDPSADDGKSFQKVIRAWANINGVRVPERKSSLPPWASS